MGFIPESIRNFLYYHIVMCNTQVTHKYKIHYIFETFENAIMTKLNPLKKTCEVILEVDPSGRKSLNSQSALWGDTNVCTLA